MRGLRKTGQKSMIYGFIGTGTISEAIITGLMRSSLAGTRAVVSPRSEVIAKSLAKRYPQVKVARSNQAVVDEADLLIFAVRPQVAEEVLTALTIPTSKKLISLIGATRHDTLSSWTGHATTSLTRAIPLPFVADGEGVTAVFPADPEAERLFNAMGTALVCRTQDEFDLFAVTSALMGTYFGFLERIADWLEGNGMPARQAHEILLPLFSSLAKVARSSSQVNFSELRDAHSTKGGLNEQVFLDFEKLGGTKALFTALDRVLVRAKQ